MTITNNMNSSKVTILNILNAAFLQILIWGWEIRMTTKYGFDWGYKKPWELPTDISKSTSQDWDEDAWKL
jgi:hypothetical protein